MLVGAQMSAIPGHGGATRTVASTLPVTVADIAVSTLPPVTAAVLLTERAVPVTLNI